MLTPANIKNPARKSGYRQVNYTQPNNQGLAKHYQAYVGRGRAGDWRGPARATAAEAAQDYCDYMNGNALAPPPALKSAGHATKRPQRSQHPKRIEGRRLIREARADEDTAHPEGYVYLIGETPTNFWDKMHPVVKIGKSADHPQYRLNGLQTGNPRKLVLLGYLKVPDRHKAETDLHAKYAPLNVLQEWFRPTAALMSEFGLLADGSAISERKAT